MDVPMVNEVGIEGVANNVAPSLNILGMLSLNSGRYTKKKMVDIVNGELGAYMSALEKYGFKLDYETLSRVSGKLLWDLGFRPVLGDLPHVNTAIRSHLWLFPCWIYKFIPKDMILTSMHGFVSVGVGEFGDDVDKITGCLSFGAVLPLEKYEDVMKYKEDMKMRLEKAEETVIVV